MSRLVTIMHNMISEIQELFLKRGAAEYHGEQVSQLEHALQCADLAIENRSRPSLICAALLHDLGHLLEGASTTTAGVREPRHEVLAEHWLATRFAPDVLEPIRLHVDAKRYLCAVDRAYLGTLSAESRRSLVVQGGPMSADEVASFEGLPYWRDAVVLRRWDDLAKVPGLSTRSLNDYLPYLEAACDVQDSTCRS